MSRPKISDWHVIWAYEDHIIDWHGEGLSVNAIRAKLREESSLHVGADAIRAVLASHGIS